MYGISLKYFIGFASGRYLSYLDQKGLLKVKKIHLFIGLVFAPKYMYFFSS